MCTSLTTHIRRFDSTCLDRAMVIFFNLPTHYIQYSYTACSVYNKGYYVLQFRAFIPLAFMKCPYKMYIYFILTRFTVANIMK